MILQSKCTGQYTVYVDYYICMCVSYFLLHHKASGGKRMWPLHLFVLMHLRKQKNGRPGHSIWHKTPWLQQHLGGGLQLLLGRIEVGFLEFQSAFNIAVAFSFRYRLFLSMWNMSSKQVAEENTCYWWTNNSFQRTGNQSTICRRLLPFFCFFPAVPGQFCILHFAYIYTAYAAVVKLQFITIGGSCNYRPLQ